MTKKTTETIFGYDIDRRSPTRVVVSKDGKELLDLRGQKGFEGDDLVKSALDRVMGVQPEKRTDAHVIDVPVAEALGEAKETR